MSWPVFAIGPQKYKKLAVALAAVLGVALTSSMGFWQLSRAQTKLDWQAKAAQMAQLPILDGSLLGPRSDSAQDHAGLIHRRVELQGLWLEKYTVFLDNRQMYAKPGFYVLTPLLVQGGDDVVWVQRGWIGRDFTDRTRLAPIVTPAGSVRLQGLIAPPPSKLYALGQEGQGLIRQNVDLQDFQAETGLPLLGISVVQTGPASDGLLREWPQPASGVDKHYGYAFQWFGLALVIAFLYVWFQIVRPLRHK